MRALIIILLTISNLNCHSQDICQVSLNPSKYKDLIKNNFEELIKNANDSCILKTLDSLTNDVIENGDTSTLTVLNNICNKSDGYIAEYFEEASERIFYKNLSTFTTWGLKHRNSCIEKDLILSLSYEAADNKLFQAQIKSFINKEAKSHKLSSNKIQYIIKIVRKVDPKLVE